ncbi:MAG: PAS domain S-box protein [Syntrophobacterales bacterium]|nr:PAS domain S-box protein [Syntrophobacterales bacterium]
MHSLLRRQIQRHFGGLEGIPDKLDGFIRLIDDTYHEFDKDRELLERSLELTSQEMLQVNAEMRALLRAMPDLLITLDSDGTVLHPPVGRLDDLVIPREDIVGKKIYAIPNKEVRKRFRDALERVKETKAGVTFEYSLLVNGSMNVYEARLFPINPHRNFVIIRNITEWVEAEASLLESKRQLEERNRELMRTKNFLQGILDSSADCIVTADLAGTLLYVTPSVKKMTGYEPAEVTGKKVYDFYEKGIEDARTIMEEVREKGELRDHSLRVRAKSGEFIDVSVSISPMVDENGAPLGTLGIVRDVRERKKLESQLMHAQKMEAIGTLAGGIAHDFNNLLMGVQGYASLVLLDLDEGHPHFYKLKCIQELVKSGAALTGQLLGFARGGRYEVVPADLNEIAKLSVSLFGRTRKQVRFHERYGRDLWAVEVDVGQMRQVFLNLFVNAFDAMPEGGDVYVDTENVLLDEKYAEYCGVRPGPFVKLSVTDTGPGMDESTIGRIFEPFFTTKEMGRGTGLGLATVYGIVKGHGGIIDVHSRVGYGTTFNIYIPMSEKERKREVRPHQKVAHGSETILLVDDEEVILEVSREMLEALGYKIFWADNGWDAVDIYAENRGEIDLVILDMIMPGMSGSETFDKLKEINPHVKVILSSGYSMNGMAANIMEKGCRGFIQKPFNLEQLSSSVRKALVADRQARRPVRLNTPGKMTSRQGG